MLGAPLLVVLGASKPIDGGLSERKWSEGISSETAFWDEWLRTKGNTTGGDYQADFRRRLNASEPFFQQRRLLARRASGQTEFVVLDVGAGPLEGAGFKITQGDEQFRLEVVPVDPLARHYEVLLQKHGVMPVVRTWPLKAEELTTRFNPNYFDFVYAVNALDHSLHPMTALRQMMEVVKGGREVMVTSHSNEAARGDYFGMHQYNFQNVNGTLIIHSKHLPRDLVVAEELRDLVTSVRCSRNSSVTEKHTLLAKRTSTRIQCFLLKRRTNGRSAPQPV